MPEKKERKCWNCRKPVKGDKLFCEECEDKPRKPTADTLIIYNKI